MSSRSLARAASLVVILGSQFSEARAQSEVWESRGESVRDHLGTSVDLFGDLDGDGLPEILAGAPDDMYATLPGRALIFGSATGAVLREWNGTAIGDRFGEAVADAGDVDGDGVDDAILAVPQDVPTAPYMYTGAVQVHSGATGALIHRFVGASGMARFGEAVAGPGDLDGDGRGDIVATSVQLHTVYAYSGASGALLWQYTSGSSSGYFGRALDVVGDVDGDGTPDLVVGATYDHSQGTNHGAAYVLSGRTGSLIRILVDRTSENSFGAAVSGAGDVDGDGTPDVLVGNPGYSSPLYGQNCGAISVISGATGKTFIKRISTTPDLYLGTSVSECGDLDGDGVPDFAGGEGLVGGSDVLLYSGKSGTLLRSLAPVYYAARLEIAPDLDGDGTPDFLAGSPLTDHVGDLSAEGAAFTFSGASGSTIQLNRGRQRFERRGAAVAVLADIDGDAWRDVLVGSPSELNYAQLDAPGRVLVLSGRDGSELRRHDGAAIGDNYGERIVAIPDFTGDGVPDYAIAATGAAVGAVAIEVRSGSDGALIYTYNSPSGGKGLERYGNDLAAGKGPNGRVVLAVADSNGSGLVELYDMATGSLLLATTGDVGIHNWGACVSFVGDVDGDGEGDWIGGAPADGPYYFGAGAAILFSGATGAKLQRFDGASNDWLGFAVTGIGDLDGDGVPDVLVSAPDAANQFGEVSAWSSATGSQLFKLTGTTAGTHFGRQLALLGDVNRDGVDDFAVTSDEPEGGRVYVYSGRTQGLLAWFEGTADHDFGPQIATAAGGVELTVDPDAIPDLLLGAPSSYVPSDDGYAVLRRLDDLVLQVHPSSVAPGAALSVDTRGGPSGHLVGLFAVDFSGVPLDAFVAFGTFDALGSFSLGGAAPPGLSGNTLALRSYAIGFNGMVVDSQDATLTFE
jgi:hypothetical protein